MAVSKEMNLLLVHTRALAWFLDRLNRRFAAGHPEQTELEARIASYELAFRMPVSYTHLRAHET